MSQNPIHGWGPQVPPSERVQGAGEGPASGAGGGSQTEAAPPPSPPPSFTRGDVVMLRSGGPHMTVEKVLPARGYTAEKLTVRYVDVDDRMRTEEILAGAVRLVEQDEVEIFGGLPSLVQACLDSRTGPDPDPALPGGQPTLDALAHIAVGDLVHHPHWGEMHVLRIEGYRMLCETRKPGGWGTAIFDRNEVRKIVSQGAPAPRPATTDRPIRIGDTVNDGRETMSVEAFSPGEREALCGWTDASGRKRGAWRNVADLRRVG